MQGDYRSVLKTAFEDRLARNPRYSLRALARDLGLAPSHLSGVFAGKLGLSRVAAERIAGRLGLQPAERLAFLDMVEERHARSQSARRLAAARVRRWQKIQGQKKATMVALDHFRVIADWYHFAVLEATRLTGTNSDMQWLGRRLGIPMTLARLAVQRLKRLRMIDVKNGRLIPRDEASETPTEIPSAAIRQFHQQILTKAGAALESQLLTEREFRSSIMAIKAAKIPAAKAMIQKFVAEFGEEIGGEAINGVGGQDEIYVLATQFFKVSEPEGKR